MTLTVLTHQVNTTLDLKSFVFLFSLHLCLWTSSGCLFKDKNEIRAKGPHTPPTSYKLDRLLTSESEHFIDPELGNWVQYSFYVKYEKIKMYMNDNSIYMYTVEKNK